MTFRSKERDPATAEGEYRARINAISVISPGFHRKGPRDAEYQVAFRQAQSGEATKFENR